MPQNNTSKANRMMAKTLASGILLAVAYICAAFNAGSLSAIVAGARWYTALGMATVALSLHAVFALSLYSTLRARAELQRSEEEAMAARKRSAQRARARAFINPWHNMKV